MKCNFCNNESDYQCSNCGCELCDDCGVSNYREEATFCEECNEFEERDYNETMHQMYEEEKAYIEKKEKLRLKRNEKAREYYWSEKQIEKRRCEKEIKKIYRKLRRLHTAESIARCFGSAFGGVK